MRQLSAGAEDTSSSEDEGDDTEEAQEARRARMARRNISSSMQRCIDRILKSSIEAENTEGGKVIDDDGKIRFNRLRFDFDQYRTILEKIKGFDYKKLKDIPNFIQQTTDEDRKQSKYKIISSIKYNDDLGVKQLMHIESVFQRMCKKCDKIKIPQSHHCSTCGHCLARMDHHCPWVNNCVGYYN